VEAHSIKIIHKFDMIETVLYYAARFSRIIYALHFIAFLYLSKHCIHEMIVKSQQLCISSLFVM